MRRIIQSTRFKRDYKRAMKRGLDSRKLEAVIGLLLADKPLPARCRPHRLSGAYGGFWECHIEPDWLLVYDVRPDFLELAATGTHADLFE
ncbi:MAG: type II toxin-antitoxin system YafQ family toxin [Rhizobiales bacterium]|nr:type II toxin-antitoxin system YafQ family toxin [Hyphomicrobiales bacterium]